MPKPFETDTLYFGDNLGWMRQWPDESIDLVYLDPPFNSNDMVIHVTMGDTEMDTLERIVSLYKNIDGKHLPYRELAA